MLWIQDNFFQNPDEVRQRGLQMKYRSDIKLFPGARTVGRYKPPGIVAKFRNFQGEKLKLEHGFFQFFGVNHRKSYVHIDRKFLWSGIVFLSKRDDYPGTSFYRHKETGIDHIEDDPLWRFLNFIDTAAARLNRDRFDLTKWKKTLTVPAKYNRLILFRTNYYHMNASRWGTTPENGRLTYNFFLR